MGILYLVSTPIGNLKDITLRAVETLGAVDLILAEDTRKSGRLLAHFNIKKPLLSFHEHNELLRIPAVIEKLKKGQDLALISDAGTPLISDPGFKLVRECVQKNIKVETIPGPSAVLAALSGSGLPTNKFIFLGYLPKKGGKAKEVLKEVGNFESTLIMFESPHRLVKNLNLLKDFFGNKNIVVARELTKIHEEYFRDSIENAINYFEKNPPKGEITLLIY